MIFLFSLQHWSQFIKPYTSGSRQNGIYLKYSAQFERWHLHYEQYPNKSSKYSITLQLILMTLPTQKSASFWHCMDATRKLSTDCKICSNTTLRMLRYGTKLKKIRRMEMEKDKHRTYSNNNIKRPAPQSLLKFIISNLPHLFEAKMT